MNSIFININLFMTINEYTDLRSFCDTTKKLPALKSAF